MHISINLLIVSIVAMLHDLIGIGFSSNSWSPDGLLPLATISRFASLVGFPSFHILYVIASLVHNFELRVQRKLLVNKADFLIILAYFVNGNMVVL